ncbi:MAG: WD40 repeat domain-containing protein, partial [Phycisphaerae bacterium]
MKLGGSGAGTNYRIPSGRIPSCYTLLAGEKLGVRNPVLFSDNLGFLAMWDSSGDELRRVFGGHESMITSISPSSSGQIFVTGSTDRTIRIWSLLNHRKSGIFDFKYENSSVIRVIPGSSSEEAGVRVGDRIVSVDGHTLDEIYEMMLYGRYTYQPDQ